MALGQAKPILFGRLVIFRLPTMVRIRGLAIRPRNPGHAPKPNLLQDTAFFAHGQATWLV